MGCVKCRHVGTRMGYGSVGMLEHGVECVRFRHVGTLCGVYEV